MSDLLDKKCIPCEGGILPFDISKIHKYQKKVDGWDILKDEKKNFFLNKKFKFNYRKSKLQSLPKF
jgi:4a-hydroxytetrahydrobiopterin dehydratase